MKNIIFSLYFKVFVVIFILLNWYHIYKKNNNHNNEICEVRKIAIKGFITSNGGHGMYLWTEINNLKKSVSLNISKTKFIKGFPDDYTYEVGDSIIKKAGSKEFTVKRGNNIAVHIIDCDD